MAIGDVSLTGAMRNTLISLQDTGRLMDRTQERLSTGKKVNSALDNPANYFAAKAHNSRASQLDGRKDAMGESLQALKTADKAVEAISTLMESLRGIVSAARSTDGGASTAQVTQYTEIRAQIDFLIEDASYKGTNFLEADTLDVVFDEQGDSVHTAGDAAWAGVDSDGLLTATALVATDTGATLDTLEDNINTALDSLRDFSSGLAASLSIIQTRVDFTTDMVNTLTEGATKLTIADSNEEGANMLMLQTRQQLGTTALSLASQAAQSVLRLF
jgi:flagellin